MENIYYIGRFPGPYGGVTVKNELIFNELSNNFNINKFNTNVLKENKILGSINLIKFIIKNKNNKGIIGVSSKSLIIILKILNLVPGFNFKSVHIFVMGGNLHTFIKNKNKLIKLINKTKVAYVECDGILKNLSDIGIENCEVIPNFRKKPSLRKLNIPNNKILKGIFFSRINKEKGVDKIFIAIENKKDIEIDFYGEIDSYYLDEFNENVKNSIACKYKGVIKPQNENIYSILSMYDFLIFPTRYEGEGVPGILIESKIAGLPVITTKWKYNGEIVNNLIDGIIIDNNSPNNILNAINLIKNDIDLRIKLRKNAFNNANKFFIENYIDKIIK